MKSRYFLVCTFLLLSASILAAQDQKLEELGQLKLSDVSISETINGNTVIPVLGEEEGILLINLGPKLQALLQSQVNNLNDDIEIAIQLGRDIELLTEKKSIRFPQQIAFEVRFKARYVGKQQSSRPTIQIAGLSYFSEYNDVIRVYKNKVNTVLLEVEQMPKFTVNSAIYSEVEIKKESKKVKGKRKKMIWFFILTSVAGTAYLLTTDHEKTSNNKFPLPPARPNN